MTREYEGVILSGAERCDGREEEPGEEDAGRRIRTQAGGVEEKSKFILTNWLISRENSRCRIATRSPNHCQLIGAVSSLEGLKLLASTPAGPFGAFAKVDEEADAL